MRCRPFSCSRWLLDNQKKRKKRRPVKKSTKNQEKKRKNGPHRSQSQSWVGGTGIANGYQPTIKKASTGCHIGINGVSGGCDQVVGREQGELVTKGVRKSNPEASGRVSRASGGFPESGEAPQADQVYFSGKDREN
jgi:hypothetical protein